jgi:hypothetical protein
MFGQEKAEDLLRNAVKFLEAHINVRFQARKFHDSLIYRGKTLRQCPHYPKILALFPNTHVEFE